MKKFLINPTNEFHVLRHFKYVDSSYKKTLIEQPDWYYDFSQKKFVLSKILERDIKDALHTIGTKFDKNIQGMETPEKLLECIREKFQELSVRNEIVWVEREASRTAIFNFNYPFFVGRMNCISIDNVLEKDRTRIQRVLRSQCPGEGDIMVNTLSDWDTAFTKSVHVEIVETQQLPFYTITAYPDCPLTHDVPNEKLVFVV